MDNEVIKVISATYKLLDFFPEGDPLKNKAKELVLMMMAQLSGPTPPSGVEKNVLMLEDYLELAKNMGWVDNMNFLIVKKEWEIIKKNLPKAKIDEMFIKEARPKEIGRETFSPRQGKILSMLGKKEKVQVQDIIKEMPKVTKRTIRRDLDELLKKGEIIRVGEFNQVFYQKA